MSSLGNAEAWIKYMEALTVEERLLLAWYAALDDDERAMIDGWTLHGVAASTAPGASPPPSADFLHLLRRDLQQLLEITAPQGSD